MDTKNNKNQDYISNAKRKNQYQLIMVLIGFFVIVIGSLFVHFQSDWTNDKKYSITQASKDILRNLEEEVHIELFLAGDELPAAFKSLSKSSELTLKQFRNISKNKLTYTITDPLKDNSDLALEKLSNFKMSGIPVTISAGKKGTSQKMVFPWALVSVKTKEGQVHHRPVFLQETNTPELSRSILNRSEALLEYNFVQAIEALNTGDLSKVAYLTGNGEPFGFETLSLFREISQHYHLDTLNINEFPSISSEYKTVFINQPQDTFTEIQKFKLDQYIMHGGQVVWAVDGAHGTLDSLQMTGDYNSMPLDLNLSDLFFHYGFRVNQNIVLDALNYVDIPLMASGFDQAEPTMFPWLYYPILESNKGHLIGQQINGVLAQFASNIDFNNNDEAIRKIPLLTTSRFSKVVAVPAPVILESAMEQVDERQYTAGELVVGALLEGNMTSFYARRQPTAVQEFMDKHKIDLKRSTEEENAMVVFADGHLFTNLFSEEYGPMDMGTYQFSDYQFDNKVLLNNVMTYLNKNKDLLGARAKDFEVRLLDPKTVRENRNKMQWVNIAVPISMYVLLAGVWIFVRRRKYA